MVQLLSYSGPNDHVFINFVDHGATGMVSFPDDYLYADTLVKTLKKMHKKNMFKRVRLKSVKERILSIVVHFC